MSLRRRRLIDKPARAGEYELGHDTQRGIVPKYGYFDGEEQDRDQDEGYGWYPRELHDLTVQQVLDELGTDIENYLKDNVNCPEPDRNKVYAMVKKTLDSMGYDVRFITIDDGFLDITISNREATFVKDLE